jgi:tryptophan halogenase
MKIVIVGGGTAGWLTALYTKKVYPHNEVVLVESEELGILGAGEGSTPHLISFLDFLEIPVSDLIKNCYATIKNGIKFSNWGIKESYFYHPFMSKNSSSNDFNYSLYKFLEEDTNFSHIYASNFNHKMKDYVLMQKISEKNAVPFLHNSSKTSSDPLNEFDQISYWSLHFDANVLAKYLRIVGESRGIVRKEGFVNEIISNEDGYITSLKTDKETLFCDFVFDCSGFRRLIIGNHYKTIWKSHSDYLPAKKAIPFFLKKTEDIPAYTESRAMNYGWMWQIPLQHRYGCGYVYDSDFISDSDAKSELDTFFGFEVESPKTFSFDPGYFTEIWKKNCLAVGLSAGFIEPLEATSIMQAIYVLERFMSNPTNITTKNTNTINKFNKIFIDETQEVVDFIYLHYITKKENTNFWKDFTKNNKVPEFVQYVLDIVEERPLYNSFDFLEKKFFQSYAYSYVLLGNEVVGSSILNKHKSFLVTDKTPEYLSIISKQNSTVSHCATHKSFIDYIKTRKGE